MTKPASPSWFAVETKPNAEYTARTEMERVGLTVYLPEYRREYHHRRYRKWIARSYPLFMGYIFVAAEELDWGALTTCKGLEREGLSRDGVLRDALGNPVKIGDAEIQAIREKAEAGAFDELRGRTSGLRPGQHVALSQGPLAGMEALVARVRSGRNVRVLLSMFGSQVEATVPLANLSRAA